MRSITRRPAGNGATFLCGPDSEIRDVMALFNQVEDHFILVMDDDHQLLGTVTDGDLRRALLRSDITTSHPVTACMQKSPLTGTVDQHDKNERALWELNSSSPFLPIVDADGRVTEVLVGSQIESNLSTALVLAGGLGKRLGEKTRNTPKPLLTIGEKPILDHTLGHLERAGVSKIYVAVHYLAEQIADFVASRDNQAEISLLHEEAPLGTAGSISLMPEDMSDHFLVINGDVMTSVDFELLETMHRRNENDATIAVAQHEVEIPYGIIQHNDDGQFLGIREKPMLNHFVAAGIYYLSPVFKSLVPKNTKMDMPELLNAGRKFDMKIGLFPMHEYWADIGQPQDFEAAQRDHEGRG